MPEQNKDANIQSLFTPPLADFFLPDTPVKDSVAEQGAKEDFLEELLKGLKERVDLMLFAKKNDKEFPIEADYEGLAKINCDVVALNDHLIQQLANKYFKK